MNTIDILLGIIFLLAFITGLKKGLFVTLASLIGLILGVYGAIYFSDYVADYISDWFSWSEQLTNLAAFAVTFCGIVFVVSLAGKFLTKIASFAFLGIFNKILGGLFNVLIFAFIVSVIFMFFNDWENSDYVISEEKKENSMLYEPVASIAPLLFPYIIKEVDKVKNSEEESPKEE
jgi:membrane protein required for colicin V production